MMDIEFSIHCLEQMNRRNINKLTVLEVINNFENRFDGNDFVVYQKTIENYLYRVFVNEDKSPKLIITTYKTSKFNKYEG